MVAFYWLFNAFFIFVELTGTPSSILQYRIQPKKKPAVVEWQTFKKCLKVVLLNQLAVGYSSQLALYWIFQKRGGLFAETLPSFQWCLVELAISMFIFEVIFFYSHRFNQNFGMLGIFDFLYGTDSRFRKSKSYERHSMLLGTTPANVLIPDEPKKCQ
ncbi:fatty acid hydroxylase domain-containing protein 2-like [Sycon ciliatum]|uniref:fatty acid hydroxylase domain-containing protein 2-like n=1 Tax=Sycon ciliatum TaxID=27933 RepID=UPI0031F5F80E